MVCEKCKGDCFEVDIGKLERASYMIIAERPTLSEIASQKKFTKGTFKYLVEMLQKTHFDEKVYVTYMQKTNVPYTAVRARKCYTHLLAEIAAVKPKVILCLGPNTGRFITGKTGGVDELRRGEYFDTKLKAWIKCTHSPEMIFRSPTFETEMQLDIERFKALKYERRVNQVPLVVMWFRSVQRNLKILNAMLQWKNKVISFDIEASGLDYCKDDTLALGFAWDERYSYCLPRSVLEDEEIQTVINLLFQTNNIFVGQNAKFDVSFLRYSNPFKNVVIPNARYDEDTMLMHYCINEQSGTHGLKVWAKDYFNAPDWEEGIKKYLPNKEAPYSLIPEPVLMKYLAYDVHYTLKGYKLFLKLMKVENTERAYREILLPASKAFTEIEMEGVLLDVDSLKQKMAEAQPQIERITEELNEEALKVGWSPEAYQEATGAKEKPKFLNPKSSKQMQFLMYDLCKMPLWNMGRDGYKKSCCKDAVEVYRYRHPLWAKLYEYKQVHDLFGIYVKGMLERVDGDNRIRPDFYLTGTVTGRISCHDPNLQNIPRKSFVKQMFIASEGCVIINTDYKTLEVVVAAILSGDTEMQKPFILGTDFHSQTTEKCYKHELADIRMWCEEKTDLPLREYLNRPQMAEVREYITRDYLDKEDWKGTYDQIFDYLRFLTKFITFGIMYGRGAKSLAEGELNCSLVEAQEYIENFLEEYPRFTEWMRECEECALTKGYIQTAFGHKRRWMQISNDESYLIRNQSVNTPIQGTAAQITLRALWKLHEVFKKNPVGRILFTVHDSIVFEVKKEYLNVCCNMIKHVMTENPISANVPLSIDIEMGLTYGDVFPLVEESGIWVPKKQKHLETFSKIMYLHEKV